MLEWTFETTTTTSDGLNDPAISHFKGNLIGGLARESLQNSIDARDKSSDKPVLVVFKMHELEIDEIPGLGELREYFKKGKIFIESSQNVNKDHVKFYEQALETFQLKKIPVLEISDYNTIGLQGDSNTNGSSFYNLVIAEGDTSGDTARGGSFGLGKGALYNASKIRNLIFSSLSASDGHRFLGKMKMSSFKDDSGNRHRGVGLFGLSRGLEVTNETQIPELFRRKENGLSAFAVAFREPDDWEEKVLRRVLTDFWLSIAEGTLEVNINDSIHINKNSLDNILREHFSSELQDSGGYGKKDESPLPGYLAYKEGALTSKKLPILGSCRLYLNNDPRFMSKISHFRVPKMLIYKKGYRYATTVQGCFICEDQKGNEILRATENPEHLEWQTKNVDENSDISKTLATEALREVRDFIENQISKFSGYNGEESIDFLLDWDDGFDGLGNESEEISPEGKAEEEEGLGIVVNEEPVELNKIKPAPRVVLPSIVSAISDKGRKNGNKSKARKTKKGEPGDGEGAVETELTFRSFISPIGDDNYHTVLIKESGDRVLDIEFYGATDSSQEAIEVAAVYNNKANFKGNKIFGFSTKNNKTIKVLFKDNLKHPLLLKAFVSKDQNEKV